MNRMLGRIRCSDHQDSEPAEINLAPMIDILFILLIFFLVASTFVRESGVAVERPDAVTASQLEDSAILVAIRANGEIWVDGQAVDLRRLRTTITRLHAHNPRSAAILQADEAGNVGLLVKVMDHIRLAGVSDIAIAAEPQ